MERFDTSTKNVKNKRKETIIKIFYSHVVCCQFLVHIGNRMSLGSYILDLLFPHFHNKYTYKCPLIIEFYTENNC